MKKSDDRKQKYLARHKKVCESKLYQFLRFDPIGRGIMVLLEDNQISKGEAAKAIVEAFELKEIPELPQEQETEKDEEDAPGRWYPWLIDKCL